MDKKNRMFFNIIRTIIIVVALGNLAALFIFHYEIPDFLKDLTEMDSSAATGNSDETSEASAVSDTRGSETTAYSFIFDTDTLTYDGASRLDLLTGVSIVSSKGQKNNDAKIFAHITTGDSLSRKIIEYSADTDEGRITAQRNLELMNYNGPSIELPEILPQMEDSQADSVLDIIASDKNFRADDGFGNDITKAVKVRHKRDEHDSRIIHFTFTVTNSFNDTVSAEKDADLIRVKPVIVLKETSVTLPLHSQFNPLDYVAAAENTDGSSLFNSISISGIANTETSGEYVLTFTVSSPDGAVSDPQELKVTVQ